MSNLNVRIPGIIENESCPSKWVDPKTVFEPLIETKNSPLGPKKVQNKPKIKSKSYFRIEGNKENKSFALYEWTSKQFEPDPNPQNSISFTHKKPKKYP